MAKRRRGVKKSRDRKAHHLRDAGPAAAHKTAASSENTAGPGKSASQVAAWKVALLLFGSGACALIYQIAWLREFRLIFGVSTTASAAVLAIFMAGLGAGTFVLGRRVDSSPRPLHFYARLEASIAVFTVATPLLLTLVRSIYIALGGTAALGSVVGTIVRLLLATLVLAIPTMLMGGTLPAAARALVAAGDEHRGRVGLVYGINTLGSVVGCLLATFVLLEALGTRATLWSACAANITIATIAYFVARPLRPIPVDKQEPASEASSEEAEVRNYFIPAAAALVGFVFFLMELVWYRLLGPILGGTVFTFGLVLATALLGIGIGGALYAIGASRTKIAPLRAFGYACMAEAFALAIPFVLGDRIAMWASQTHSWASSGFGVAVFGWFLVTVAMVFLPAVVAGMQFPMLIAALGRGRKLVGKQMGIVYLANTLGAIAGSLAGVFGLMQFLTIRGSWQLSTVLLIFLGLAAFLASSIRSGVMISNRQRVLSFSAAAVLLALVVVPTGPTGRWRHGGIGAGRAGPVAADANDWRRLDFLSNDGLIWEEDGIESSVALYGNDGLSFIVNGKSDGNTIIDASTTIMLALLPAILHPSPKRSLVIGLGTGMTAGWLAQVSDTEHVEVVELEPAILRVASAASTMNFDVLHNKKVHVTLADAREYLLTTDQRYEVIVSEPSNPYRSGVASLFTVEFYESVSDRLSDDGIFVQWVQAYEIDDQTMSTLYATLGQVFPYVDTWQLASGDLAFLGSQRPIDYDLSRLRGRFAAEPFAQALHSVLRLDDLEALMGLFVANADFTKQIAASPAVVVNTDNHNQVEFGFARSLGKTQFFKMVDLRTAAHNLKMHRPATRNGELDPEALADAELSSMVSNPINPQYESYFAEAQLWRFRARQLYELGKCSSALEAWSKQPREPKGASELLLVAECLAEAGRPEADSYASRLMEIEPASAYAILAKLAFMRGDQEAAFVSLSAAIKLFRSYPWTPRPLMTRTIELTTMLRVAPMPLFDLLAEPFAAFNLNRHRRLARLTLATSMLNEVCVEAFADFEPHVPWNEGILRRRVECYERNNNYRLAKIAKQELATFLANAAD